MYGYNAEQPIAIPIYTVLPYCVITRCKSGRESKWDLPNKLASSWDLNPGLYEYRSGTLTTELLNLCGRGVQEMILLFSHPSND